MRSLDWAEVEHYLFGNEARRQRELAGHRLTANLIFNALSEEGLKPADFLYLPTVDGPKIAKVSAISNETMSEYRARLAEQNKQKLAAMAASK